jgi:hypothetical protein
LNGCLCGYPPPDFDWGGDGGVNRAFLLASARSFFGSFQISDHLLAIFGLNDFDVLV